MSTEPIELVTKARDHVVGFVCGKCKSTSMMMFPVSYFGPEEERLNAARRAATEHCGPWFCACGAEKKTYYRDVCETCFDKAQQDKLDADQRTAFKKAEKVPADKWSGEYVWSDRFETIFGEIGELLERYEDEGEEPPAYVWECEREDLTLDAGDILDAAFEQQEAWEGARDHVSPADQEELQALLDGWLAKRKLLWWRESRHRAVLLPEREDGSQGGMVATEPR